MLAENRSIAGWSRLMRHPEKVTNKRTIWKNAGLRILYSLMAKGPDFQADIWDAAKSAWSSSREQEFTVKPVGIAAGSINSFGIVPLENGTGSSHEIGFQPSFVGSTNIHRFVTHVKIQHSLNAIFNSFSCFDKRTVLWHDVFSLICDIYI